jgi:subtilisin
MSSSRIAEESFRNLGYVPVVVVVNHDTAAARGGTAAAAAEPSNEIVNNFLTKVPEGAKTSLDVEKDEEPFKFFPLLGIYAGYMDKQGVKNTEEKAAKVYDAAARISLIRPVFIRAAESAGDRTWGLEKIRAPELWNQGLSGNGVDVGIIDTGVDPRHETLRGRVKKWIDTDNNGDIIQDSRPPEDAAYDDDDHGTHTAGTVAGGLANGMAIGVAPKCNLHVVKAIEGGRALLRVLTGMQWCLEQKVRVLSMSLGFPWYDEFLLDVSQRIRDNGAVFICAIGNEGPGTFRIPGAYAPPLAIGATDSNDRVAPFSSSSIFNRPNDPIQPNLVAPGVNVISAKPGGGVQAMSGTSMATPHVAGLAALLVEHRPNATVHEIETAILESCKPLHGEKKERYGRGLVDAVEAANKLKNIG